MSCEGFQNTKSTIKPRQLSLSEMACKGINILAESTTKADDGAGGGSRDDDGGPDETDQRVKHERDYLATLANVHTCYGHRGSREGLKIAMLTAYFDESGIHTASQACVVAGWVGNDAQWQALIADWIPALKPRQNLHMKELRWNQHPERIRPLLAKLGAIPYRYNLKPVYCGMWHKDYEDLMKGKVREQYTTPWMNCAQTCLALVLGEIAGSEEVLFLFDRQHVNQRSMQALNHLAFQLMGVDSRIKDVQFIKRTNTVCLDPADYLAFQVRELREDPKSDKAQMGMSILSGKPHGGFFTREQITERTAEWVKAGIVPGGGPVRPTLELFKKLMANPYWRGPQPESISELERMLNGT